MYIYILLEFSPTWPSGPSWSSSRHVCLHFLVSVLLSAHIKTYNGSFKWICFTWLLVFTCKKDNGLNILECEINQLYMYLQCFMFQLVPGKFC